MKKGEIAKKIILAAASAETIGGLSVSLTNVPGVGAVIKPFIDWYKNQDKYGRYRIRKTFAKLRRQGLIEIKTDENNKTKIVLTDEGRKKVSRCQFEDLKIEPQKKWDKKWRLVIFDIPRSRQKARFDLRAKLNNLYFYKLQQNVWIYPYECKKEIDFIANVLNIKHFMTIVEALPFDGDNFIRRNFGI